ncbi:MAG: preprotein translocase subunit SecG [Firmicutes bacterium]|nr:preprotein translocase subunit SecG [Bacillota bacterium]
MLVLVLQIIFVIVCLGLIAVVLLQSGRSTGLGAIAGGAQTLFGKKKGIDDRLSQFTTWLAVAFMILSVLLAFLS